MRIDNAQHRTQHNKQPQQQLKHTTTKLWPQATNKTKVNAKNKSKYKY